MKHSIVSHQAWLFPVFGLLSALLWINPANSQTLNNQLKDHPAPYLALHGDDPVHWQDWGEAALEKARKSNKILLLSVGYFSCHWCHVMQRETYQDATAVEYINRHFIPVKIDKELEPALDRRLMDFAQRIIGRGGWPLNVFVSPDGYPIYAVLYAPTSQFMEISSRIQLVWLNDSKKVNDLVSNEVVRTFDHAAADLDPQIFKQILATAPTKMLASADTLDGGFGEQQKFPSTPQLAFLLDQHELTKQEEIADFLKLTLSAMANRGLYDHLTGGFFRYSVDPGWEIPHFEKMLYDNVNLAGLYLRASRVLQRPELAVIARQTLDFMQSRMMINGALISSFSAVDDDNVEGGHYLWTLKQLKPLLSAEQIDLATAIWGLERPNDLPEGNHLRFDKSLTEFANENNTSVEQAKQLYASIREKLTAARDRRSLPADDKLITAWNALALSLYIEAAETFDDDGYAATAEAIRRFLVERIWDGEQLARSEVKGDTAGSAALEDYAYTAKALYQWSLYAESESDARLANDIAQLAWEKFYRGNGWYEDDGSLIAAVSGEELLADGATVSPAAVLIDVSLALATRFDDPKLRDQALSALNRGQQFLDSAPFWFAGQLSVIQSVLPHHN